MEHHRRTGSWPVQGSGPVAGTEGETWTGVDQALRKGRRKLPGGDSLARLLARKVGVRNGADAPRLTVEEILRWADAHFESTGIWPKDTSGPVAGAPGETWMAIDVALRVGARGLPKGLSLARLLAARRGVRNRLAAPPLSEEQSLAWADAHRRRTGRWPTPKSGAIPDSGGETWCAVDGALRQGRRGLVGRRTLSQFLADHGRGERREE